MTRSILRLPRKREAIRAPLAVQLVKNLPAVQETPGWIPSHEDRRRRERQPTPVFLGFPGGSAGKESARNTGDLGSIPGLGRSPGEGKGCPLCMLAWGHREQSGGRQRGGRWGSWVKRLRRLRGTNSQLQSSLWGAIYSERNATNIRVPVCGGRWLLDLKWWSIHNVYKGWKKGKVAQSCQTLCNPMG